MKTINTSTAAPVFELKGSIMTIIVLHIRQTDADCLYPQLVKKLGQARPFFKSAPVLIDLSTVDDEGQVALDFKYLTHMLRKLGLVPIGVRGGAACLNERVLEAGLGLLPPVKTERTVAATAENESPEPEAPNKKDQPEPSDDVSSQVAPVAPVAPGASAKVITKPVRSGQQVFAPEGDLVILSSVNAGAEVLAAGNIHVYGALRGRAMAGIHGDDKARIISLQCNPELVSVAGEYMVNELLDDALLNHSVIVSLKDGSLKFEVVGSFNPFS
jgi:septum site-determining protein MinC